MQFPSKLRRERVFYGFALFQGGLDALPRHFVLAIARQEIGKAFVKVDNGIVPHPFIGVNNEKWQRADFRSIRHGPGPEHMEQYAAGNFVIMGFTQRPGRAKLCMAASIADAICFCNIMQQGGCANCGRAHVKAQGPGFLGQSGGNFGHLQAVAPDIWPHGVFFPQGKTGPVARRPGT